MRVAVVDCGTNTVRLLIADAGPDGVLTEVVRDLRFARLGEGVDATGSFRPDALDRTFSALDDYATIIHDSKVDKVRFVATSAARDVSNREDFYAGVRTRLNVDPDVISGEEEAELSFLGALAGGPLQGDPDTSVLVIDIGGGSTELIRGTASGHVDAAVSLDMGSVRIRERFVDHDPPEPTEVSATRQFINDMLDTSPVSLAEIGVWIGVAGTMTSLSGMHQGLQAYDRTKVHNSVMTQAQIDTLTNHLVCLPVPQIIHDYPSLPPQRAEIIGTGALICAEIARRVRQPVMIRETDILDGAAQKLVRS